MKSVILIPARFHSTRFEGKPLALIKGKPMIEWVYQNLKETQLPVYVVTDHPHIQSCVEGFGGKVLRIDDDLPSGTHRIYQAYKRFLEKENFERILNVQGDEPLIQGKSLQTLLQFHQDHPQFDWATLVRERIGGTEDFHGPHVVKCVFNPHNSQCLYFSRSPVPFHKDADKLNWWQHIGVYSYQRKALEKFILSPPLELEKKENLEQLRAMELGGQIGAVPIEGPMIGVDTPEDIKKVEEFLGA